jgi:hypothetical protein
LPPSSVERMLTPVVLPPERASEATSPDATIVVGNAFGVNRRGPSLQFWFANKADVAQRC